VPLSEIKNKVISGVRGQKFILMADQNVSHVFSEKLPERRLTPCFFRRISSRAGGLCKTAPAALSQHKRLRRARRCRIQCGAGTRASHPSQVNT
jgi:hypothetical protein